MSTYLKTAGRFDCLAKKPQSGWFGESAKKKTPYIAIECVVNDQGTERGQSITWYGYLSDATFDNTIARLTEVFGFDGDLNRLYSGAHSLDGLPCNIETEFETHEGKERLKVKWLNAIGGHGTAPVMEDGKVKALLAKINSRAKAIAKAAGSAKVATPSAATQPDPNDDVPF